MKKLKIGIIDLVHNGPTKNLYAKVMHQNLASIMPTVIAAWCEERGHDVNYVCYTGLEDIFKELPVDADIVFIGAFTQSAFLAYSLSNLCRLKGAITVLGGPHARCYPEDAIKYFDYVTGYTDKNLIIDLVEHAHKQPVEGRFVTADKQPHELPGVVQRWKYMEPVYSNFSFLKIIPMLGSVGCPYKCPFCIDSTIPYKMMNADGLKEDLAFLVKRFKKPLIGWHDPNFGFRFNEFMDIIESTIPKGKAQFIAESSLSILTEENLKRLKRNGFAALLPGVESWYDLGSKSKVGSVSGDERVSKISDHLNMALEYVPYIQANFVLGLDSDYGTEPFELTKKFVDKVPNVIPGFSMLTAFGEAAPANIEYQKENRIRPFPFHFLNNHLAMNVIPKHYSWIEFYDRVIDLTSYTFSKKMITRRLLSSNSGVSRSLNFVRAVSHEGRGRLKFFKTIREKLTTDPSFLPFFDGHTDEVPQFYKDIIKRDLGVMYEYLPDGVWEYDHKAYLNKSQARNAS